MIFFNQQEIYPKDLKKWLSDTATKIVSVIAKTASKKQSVRQLN